MAAFNDIVPDITIHAVPEEDASECVTLSSIRCRMNSDNNGQDRHSFCADLQCIDGLSDEDLTELESEIQSVWTVVTTVLFPSEVPRLMSTVVRGDGGKSAIKLTFARPEYKTTFTDRLGLCMAYFGVEMNARVLSSTTKHMTFTELQLGNSDLKVYVHESPLDFLFWMGAKCAIRSVDISYQPRLPSQLCSGELASISGVFAKNVIDCAQCVPLDVAIKTSVYAAFSSLKSSGDRAGVHAEFWQYLENIFSRAPAVKRTSFTTSKGTLELTTEGLPILGAMSKTFGAESRLEKTCRKAAANIAVESSLGPNIPFELIQAAILTAQHPDIPIPGNPLHRYHDLSLRGYIGESRLPGLHHDELLQMLDIFNTAMTLSDKTATGVVADNDEVKLREWLLLEATKSDLLMESSAEPSPSHQQRLPATVLIKLQEETNRRPVLDFDKELTLDNIFNIFEMDDINATRKHSVDACLRALRIKVEQRMAFFGISEEWQIDPTFGGLRPEEVNDLALFYANAADGSNLLSVHTTAAAERFDERANFYCEKRKIKYGNVSRSNMKRRWMVDAEGAEKFVAYQFLPEASPDVYEYAKTPRIDTEPISPPNLPVSLPSCDPPPNKVECKLEMPSASGAPPLKRAGLALQLSLNDFGSFVQESTSRLEDDSAESCIVVDVEVVLALPEDFDASNEDDLEDLDDKFRFIAADLRRVWKRKHKFAEESMFGGNLKFQRSESNPAMFTISFLWARDIKAVERVVSSVEKFCSALNFDISAAYPQKAASCCFNDLSFTALTTIDLKHGANPKMIAESLLSRVEKAVHQRRVSGSSASSIVEGGFHWALYFIAMTLILVKSLSVCVVLNPICSMIRTMATHLQAMPLEQFKVVEDEFYNFGVNTLRQHGDCITSLTDFLLSRLPLSAFGDFISLTFCRLYGSKNAKILGIVADSLAGVDNDGLVQGITKVTLTSQIWRLELNIRNIPIVNVLFRPQIRGRDLPINLEAEYHILKEMLLQRIKQLKREKRSGDVKDALIDILFENNGDRFYRMIAAYVALREPDEAGFLPLIDEEVLAIWQRAAAYLDLPDELLAALERVHALEPKPFAECKHDLRVALEESHPGSPPSVQPPPFPTRVGACEEGNERPPRVLFCCIGSRGDVQPLVALALGMAKRGYEVAFWTVRPMDAFVEKHGLRCFVHELNVDDMMRRVQTKVHEGVGRRAGTAIAFFSAVSRVSKAPDLAPNIDSIPESVLAAHLEYQPDLTVTSHCMPAISCAEHMKIPVVYIALQPMHPTSEFPPWAFRSRPFGKGFQWLHKPLGKLFVAMYDNETYRNGVKKCRKLLGLSLRKFSDGSTPVETLSFVPTATVISQALLPQPGDWPAWKRVSGFLMMDDSQQESAWTADDIVRFIESGPPPISIGFGSMCGDEAFRAHLTRISLRSLLSAGQRGVLLGGWAGMTSKLLDPARDAALIEFASDNVIELAACPHSWLFPRCAAVVHHGGAGTLAMGLRSGCPAVICPFMFDQEYFADLVEQRFLGKRTAPAREVSAMELSAAIRFAVTNPQIRENVQRVAGVLQKENGVECSIDFIEKAASSFPYPWPIERKYGGGGASNEVVV
jgi:sterol 3beta-glucosyltransferase